MACVVTLAIGIGATTTVFSLANAILLRPLPYPDAERLVAVSHSARGVELASAGVSDGTYLHYREHGTAFEEIATWYENVVNLSDEGEGAERVPIAMVTSTFFSVLGARTAVGRLPSEHESKAEEVVVLISHDLWQRRYGADPDIVGQMIEANRAPRRVIGVLEPGFHFPRPEIAIWYPDDPDPATAHAADLFQNGIAKLKPGVDPDDAERDLNRLVATLPDAYPDFTKRLLEDSRLRAVVTPLKDVVVGEARAALWLLMGGMAFLLLIACANVANLILVRGEHRQKEIAIRRAIGAGRRQFAGFFLAESLVLGLLGGALGLLVAVWAVEGVVLVGPSGLPRLHEVQVDAAVVAFAASVSILTALLFSLVPLVRFARPALVSALKEGGFGATASAERQRSRRLLVTGQIALALTLLVGSALMTRSYWLLKHADPGFSADGMLTAEIAMPYSGYEDYEDSQMFWDALLERVRALPGVEGAGSVSALPLVPQPAYYDFALDLEDRPDETRAAVTVYLATPGYFQTMGIPLVEGVGIQTAESAAAHPVLLSSSAARRLFPGESAIGKRLRRSAGTGVPWATVVGVVGDVPKQRIGGPPAEILYVPVLATPVDPGLHHGHGTLVVRASVPPTSLAAAVRGLVHELDPNLPLANVRTMERVVADSMSRTSFTMLLLLLAAAAALVLGAVGLYGVISYAVSRRTHEFGVRMALGARGVDVRRIVLRDGARPVLAGVALGIAAAAALTRFLRSLLYEVSPLDPLTLVAASTLLLATALLASWVPARRAAGVEPMRALRAE